MTRTPEQQARVEIDRLLQAAGWHVCGVADADIHAAQGVAVREFPLKGGHGFADYLLYVDGKAAGVIEAKKAGVPLIGVERQAERYATGLPTSLPAWTRPLPFAYESTGIETRFTNGLDPEPRSRPVFAFHRPDTLATLLNPPDVSAETRWRDAGHVADTARIATFLSRMQPIPPLAEEGLWPAQIKAIRNLEKSLAADKPRALIQMLSGSGKTLTATENLRIVVRTFRDSRATILFPQRQQRPKTLDFHVEAIVGSVPEEIGTRSAPAAGSSRATDRRFQAGAFCDRTHYHVPPL